MRGVPCLLESPEPLKDGNDFEALCGKAIRDARFGAMWDAVMMGTLVLNTERVCEKCIKAFIFLVRARQESGVEIARKRYVYGVLPGAEVKQIGDTE